VNSLSPKQGPFGWASKTKENGNFPENDCNEFHYTSGICGDHIPK
jgi:hypothetical protein